MDPRMLLDPRAALRDKKKASNAASKRSAKPSPNSDKSKQIRTSSPSPRQAASSVDSNPISPTRATPLYNPRALLDPRNSSRPHEVRKPTAEIVDMNGKHSSPLFERSDPSSSTFDDTPRMVSNGLQPMLARQDSSHRGKRMLEDVFGVEDRTAQPRKKVAASKDPAERDSAAKSQKFNSSGTGIIGDYMRGPKDPNADTRPTLLPASARRESIIDLTNDDAGHANDDDDDLVITGSNQVAEKEVFYGAVYTNCDAFLIPKPRKKQDSPTSQWPAIRCTLRRNQEDRKTHVIRLVDPHNVAFANIVQKDAKGLAPVMDVFPNLRTQVHLFTRKRLEADEIHGQCSQTMNMSVGLYGRRVDAERLGMILGHANVWLSSASLKDPGVETVNPHVSSGHRKQAREKPTTRVTGRNGVVEAGSEEATSQAVDKIFDHYASENIEETDAPMGILTPLLPHQKQALTFMLHHETIPDYDDPAASRLWSKKHGKKGVYYEEAVCNMVIENEPPPASLGGLVADVMGLGKTLETLTLIAATTETAITFGKSHVQRGPPASLDMRLIANAPGTLIICPTSTVANWESQIKEHLDPSFTWYTHHGSNRTKNVYELLKFDIVITTYGTLQSETRQGMDGVLRSLKWFRIVLDEAHTIREPSALQSQACFELEAERRWCLTGTPVQNKLADLGSLCQFLRVYPYDTVQNFQHYIVKRAGSGDSSFLKRLRVFIDSFTLRRERDRINLPDKEDLNIAVDFSEAEHKIHEFFRERSEIMVKTLVRNREEGVKKQNVQISVLQGITILRLISAHGRDLLRDDDLNQYKGGDPNEPIDLDEDTGPKTITKLEGYEQFRMMVDADFDICRNCETPITGRTPLADGDTDTGPRCYVLPCRDLVCAPCFRQYQSIYDNEDDDSVLACPLCGDYTAASYVAIEGNVNETIEIMQADLPTEKKDRYSGPHSKTLALLADIEQMAEESKALEAQGEEPLKCVVFSEFTSHLNLISRALKDRGYQTIRIDGTMSLSKRKKVLEALATDPTVTILLASIKAAGQGLNLTAASRAFIMEPLWNPASEAQAVDRIYRIGQTRKVFVKRYHMKDSIEESIMKLAEKKQKLADLSMNKNHKALSKKEMREQHYNEIKMLFESKKR